MKKEKTKFNYKSFVSPLIISIGLSVFIAIFSFFINDTAFYKSFENIFQKEFFTWQNGSKWEGLPSSIYLESKYLSDFVIIEIDDRTLEGLSSKTWPIPRSYYAKLIEKLRSAAARLICFDIIFPEKSSKTEDNALAKQIELTPNLLFAYHIANTKLTTDLTSKYAELSIIYPYKLFYDALGNNKFNKLGLVSTATDADIDGLIRSVTFIHKYNDKLLASFDIKILANIYNATNKEITFNEKNHTITIKDKIIPLSASNSLYLNFGFTPKNKIVMPNIISMSDALNMQEKDYGYFAKKIVLIGVTATAGYDIKPFPVGDMSGVYGHLNALFTVLENKFIKNISFPVYALWVLAFGIFVGLFAALLKPRFSIILLLVLFGTSIFASYKIFVSHCIFMPMFPTLANIVLVFVSVNLYKYQQEQYAKKRLSTMIREFAPLPPDYLEKVIAEKTGAAQFGGKKEKLTILFSDIRGYTNLSEKLDPVEVMNTLNEYHGAMGEIFEKNGGVIFDYQGDAQMVVFGLIDPSREEHAFYAVKSGIEMQERVKKLVEKWGKKHEFEIGVGVCTGEVSLGIVGSAQRKQYAAIGDSTNVSARLQGMSKQLESPVLISDTAYEMCKDKIIADKLEPVSLKGKSEPLQVYRAKGIK